MAGSSSIGKRKLRASNEKFVGRTEQLSAFSEALRADPTPFMILALSGQGGVGKTTMLQQFRAICDRHQVASALANEEQVTVTSVLAELARQLAAAGMACDTFAERYNKYRELKGQIEADPKMPKGLFETVVRGATRLGIGSLRQVPVAGAVADLVIGAKAEDTVSEQVTLFTRYVVERFTNRDERLLLLDTDAELTRHFITDFSKHVAKRRIVLLFDTFEVTASYLEDWLLALFEEKFGPVADNVLFVISGRHPLGTKWTDFGHEIRQIGVEPFTEAEARRYLQISGITDDAHVQRLTSASGGVPVWLAFLVSLGGDRDVDISGNAFERFLQGAPAHHRQAALDACVCRVFNEDIIRVIHDQEASRSAFDWLIGTPFVQSTERGWVYHDIVRSFMLRYLRRRSRERYAQLHSRLAEHYERALAGAADAAKDRRSARPNAQHEVERLYHRLSCDPAAGLRETLGSWILSDNHDFDQRIAGVLSQVARENGDDSLAVWADRLDQLGRPLPNEPDEAELDWRLEGYTAVCECEGLPAEAAQKVLQLRAEYLYYRAVVRLREDNTAAALDDLRLALEAPGPLRPEWYGSRALALALLDDPAAAAADASRAAERQTNAGDSIEWARFHFERGDMALALIYVSRAIELRPEAGELHFARARVHHALRDDAAASADLVRAIALEPENIGYRTLRVRSLVRHGQEDAALEEQGRVAALQPDAAHHYIVRARIHLRRGDRESAIADVTRAIERSPADARYYAYRGGLHARCGRAAVALADLTHAAQLAPGNPAYQAARQSVETRMGDRQEPVVNEPNA